MNWCPYCASTHSTILDREPEGWLALCNSCDRTWIANSEDLITDAVDDLLSRPQATGIERGIRR